MSETNLKIISNIITILEKLNANDEILSVVGSWYDTLEDETVLELLEEINKKDVLFNLNKN